MIPTRTLGAGSWWSDDAGLIVRTGRVYRYLDGWLVRPANDFAIFDSILNGLREEVVR